MPFVLGVLLIVGLGFGIYAGIQASKRWKQALAFAAQQLGLDYVEGGMLVGPETRGQTDVGSLKIDSHTVSHGKSSTTYTRIVLDVDDLPRDLIFEREGMGATFKKVFVGEDYALGDGHFDASIVARGRPQELVSRLDVAARNALLVGVGQMGMTVKEGTVTFTKAGLIRDPTKLLAIARQVVGLGRALSAGGRTAPQRLFSTASTDPVPAVRQQAARFLWRGYPGSPQAQQLAATALDSEDPGMRLLGAQRIGDADPRAGRVLLALVADGGVANGVRAEAVATLTASQLRATGVIAELVAVFRRAHSGLLVELLEALRRVSVAPPLDQLARRISSVDPEGRAAIATSAALHGAAATAMLVRSLDDDDTQVQIAAARALRGCGDLSAVEPLLPLTKGLFTNGTLKEACRGAVEAIQSRAGGGGSGGLTVVAEGAGAAGALSAMRQAAATGELSPASAEVAGADEPAEQSDALTRAEAPA